MNKNNLFALFACVFPVMGATRNTLVDIQRGQFYFIPDALYEILTQHIHKSIDEIKLIYKNKFDDIIDDYFEFLIQKELIFFTKTPHLYPSIDIQWKSPLYITNAIMDFDDATVINTKGVFTQLDELRCKSLQIRCFCDKPLEFWRELLKLMDGLTIMSVEFVVKYQLDFEQKSIFDLCQEFARISIFTAHSAPFSDLIYGAKSGIGHIYFIKEEIASQYHCGMILPDFFTVNISTFTEAHHHNSCLNRKISIDTDGNIKNCPSMSQSFGNIKDTTLQEALDHPDFKKYWNVTKDQIAVCKDCEFRYICTDCRGYIENPEDMYSKPLKCGYNPYTCEWEEWSTNPLKQKAIDYYGMREVLPEFKMKPDYVPNSPAYAGANPS